MKNQLLLFLLVLNSTANCGVFARKSEGEKALEARGIQVTMLHSEIGDSDYDAEMALITISNKSSRILTYDPGKILPYVVDNDAELQRAAKKLRLRSVLGCTYFFAAGAFFLYFCTYKVNEEKIQHVELFNKMHTQKLPGTNSRERLERIMRMAAQGGLAIFTLLEFYVGTFFCKSFYILSPKNIINEKVNINPGNSLKVLLWLKNSEKDRYALINKAIEVGQK